MQQVSKVLLRCFAILTLFHAVVPGGETNPLRKSANSAEPADQISASGKASLRSLIESGNLPELRWPDFSDYRSAVTKFYDSYGDTLPWVSGTQPTVQAQAMIEIMSKAGEKGLIAEDYDAPRWGQRLKNLKPTAPQPSEADALRFDLALTICTMRYISDLHTGRVNPKHFDFDLDTAAKKYDLPLFLKENVVNAQDLPAVLKQVEPPYPGYQRTLEALQKYRQFVPQDHGTPLPNVQKTIAPGENYPGVQPLASFLRLLGDLPADTQVPSDGTIYQGAIVDAVKSFQARHGLTPDGRLGAQTIAQLNIPLSRRVLQMQLTLERWRWMPSGFQKGPIVVNIPEFRLRAVDEEFRIGLVMNVVVGKAYDHSTPVFTDRMKYLVFRPYWNVPFSIAKSEMFPGIQRDPDYLAKKGFEVVDSRANVVGSGTVTPEMFQQLRAGKLFIRQKPGPKNSLGLVKFIFPNDYNVYMHDTPSTQLFSKSRRDFSHGCIRLEKPADLAAWVLRDQAAWNMEKIRAAMATGKDDQQVNLSQPIPVLIIYGTVVVPEDGKVHFYEDIYGHDASLEQVLAKGRPYPH